MKTKKIAIIIAAVLALLAILAATLIIKNRLFSPTQSEINQEKKSLDSEQNQPIGAQYTDSSLFLSEIKQNQTKPVATIINGLIVPHHLLAKDMIAAAFAYAAAGKYQDIVLLSPDHFQAGQSEISVTERNFATVFGTVASDQKIARRLKELSFVGAGDFFYREHGLQASLPFIRYYFPRAKIVAITFKPTVSRDKLDQVIAILKETLPPESLIVQSTDFSHYLTPTQAAIKDTETIEAINNETVQQDLNLSQPANLDSKAALYVQASLQKNFFKSKPLILEHKNSQDYTATKVASSTSYLTAAYQQPAVKTELASGNAEFIFVGDIMLSRHIGELIAKEQDYNFPLEKINPELAGADLIFGNLETPVSDKGQSAGHLYSFRADPGVIAGLKNSGFKVLSVANNHAFDYRLEAFTDTLDNLKKAGLAYAGGGHNFNEAHQGAVQEINGIKTTFLAYTDLLPKSEAATANQAGFAYLDEAQLVKDIKAAKEKSDLVIVSFHWGAEYETKSNQRQQKIATTAVKAGAALIIGHHPHVVQEIGKIQDVSVAYSLGNFIFDQNFSKETKTGLILKVKIENKKITKIEPETIRFTDKFQPYLAP